jgi:hypothetical protein
VQEREAPADDRHLPGQIEDPPEDQQTDEGSGVAGQWVNRKSRDAPARIRAACRARRERGRVWPWGGPVEGLDITWTLSQREASSTPPGFAVAPPAFD